MDSKTSEDQIFTVEIFIFLYYLLTTILGFTIFFYNLLQL